MANAFISEICEQLQ